MRPGLYLFGALFSLISFFLQPTYSHAASIDPSFKFSTIETGHFFLHYHQGLEQLAPRAAALAEEAHCLMSQTLGWSPGEKTRLVLIDNSDLANGLTNVLPYNLIFIYTVPPLPDMTIGEYDDWLRTVITHEYAHVLTMDAARGYSSVMRGIFGKPLPGADALSFLLFFAAVPPNVLLPNWWLEGTATWAETEFGGMGRGRSSYYEMIFRKAVEEDNLLTVDRINGDIPYWPARSSPYIYGLALQRYISANYGRDAIGNLNLGHAGRAPYMISAPATRVTGSHYVALYRRMLDEMKSDQDEKLQRIKSAPLTNSTALNIKGEMLTNPRLSPTGGLLAVNRRDPHRHEALVILDAQGKEIKSLVRRLPSDHGVTWGPDGRKVCFTQADLRGGYNLYQDLYCHDLEEDETTRLTHGLRIKDTDLSPDGNSFVAVVVDGTGQSLVVIDAGDDQDSLRLVGDFRGMRVSGPKWSPDGKKVVFSVKDPGGGTSLRLYDSSNGATETLIEDRHENIFPTWSPESGYIVFTSDRTGVYNLLAYSVQDGRVQQVTNLTGGAFQPEVSPDGKYIYYSSYHSAGFGIARMDFDPETWSADTGPEVQAYWPESEAEGEAERRTCEDLGAKTAGNAKLQMDGDNGYMAFSSALPRFWLPTLWFNGDGPAFGAFTAGQDVLGYHSYIAEVSASTSGRVYYTGTYRYDRFFPTLRLSAYSWPVLYSDFVGNSDLDEKQSGYETSVTFPLRRLERHLSLTVGYELKRHKTLDKPASVQVFEGRRDNVFTAIEFNNALKYPYSISPEEGRRIALTYRNYSTKRGSDVDSEEYIGTYEEFIGFPAHGVHYSRLTGAASEGDVIAQQAFRVGGTPGPYVEFPLRGYEPGFRTGRYAATATVEYRQPVYYILRGINTKPFFFRDVHVAPFVDAGIVWNSGADLKFENVDVGVGLEARLEMVFGYNFPLTPVVGFAKGISGGGEKQLYITVYAAL